MADISFSENPWASEFWNLTRQGAYVAKYGVAVAKTKAKQAGAKFGDYTCEAERPLRVVILRRRPIGNTPATVGTNAPALPIALALED